LKTCSRCKEDKLISDFHKDSSRPDGLAFFCKSCTKEYNSKYRQENKEKISARWKKWREENKEHHSLVGKEYYEKNKSKLLKDGRKYYEDNIEKIKEYSRNYCKVNRHKYRASQSRRERERQVLKRQTQIYGNNELNDLVFQEAYEVSEERSKSTGVRHHVDHIIPLKGKIVSNCSKNNKLIEELL